MTELEIMINLRVVKL